ncbi:MAG TPA: hypothetical protein VGD91_18925, partial [Trebonia sp.]
GALAAGCGSTHVSGTSGSAAGQPSSKATVPAAPTATATPVPTVSGGSVAAGEPACVGWPSSAPTGALPASFVPVSVERCVNGAQTITGKGLWTTATLQRSDGDLTALLSALRQPAGTRKPGTVCPALAVIPPQVVLISATGQKLIPRLPASGCGLTQSRVLVALGTLRWYPLSVRMITQIQGASAVPAAPTVSGTPRSIQTVSGAGAQ